MSRPTKSTFSFAEASHRERQNKYTMKCLAAFAVLILMSTSGMAGETGRRAEFIDIIGAQLDAFARNDGAAAFAHAAPNIRQLFGSPQRFMAMVTRNCAPLYRPRAVTFLDVTNGDHGLVQQMLFTGADGRQVTALYTMVRLDDGSWRIAGCVLLQPANAI